MDKTKVFTEGYGLLLSINATITELLDLEDGTIEEVTERLSSFVQENPELKDLVEVMIMVNAFSTMPFKGLEPMELN